MVFAPTNESVIRKHGKRNKFPQKDKKVYHRDKGSYGSSKTEKGRWLSGSRKETYGEEILRAHKQMNDKKERQKIEVTWAEE